MKLAEIQKFKNTTGRKIREGNLISGIRDMRSFSESAPNWELNTRLYALENNYRAMLTYMGQGVADPDRERVYRDMISQALDILDAMVRNAFIQENPSLYYSTVRTLSAQPSLTLGKLLRDYHRELRRLDEDFDSLTSPRRRANAEAIERDIFNRLWSLYPFTPQEISDLAPVFDAENAAVYPQAARLLFVSAITLGLLDFYDENRLVWLLTTYLQSPEEDVSLRALTGALIALFRFRSRPIGQKAANALATAAESKNWNSDFFTVASELMRTCSTDAISQMMKNDIIPGLEKLAPEINRKIGEGDLNPEELMEGMNPEWSENAEKSGLFSSIRELSEIQYEGGDVYMSSFGHLKNFPFFNELANWFRPFDIENSDVAEIIGVTSSFSSMIEKMPMLCDNDKYSMALSMSMAPGFQRNKMEGHLERNRDTVLQHLDEFKQMQEPKRRRNSINNYVKNLYRFFKLFRRKGEFFDFFAKVPDLLSVEALQPLVTNEDMLGALAEFYFSQKYWEPASRALKLLDKISLPDGPRAQKIGYALEHIGDLDGAIAAYEEAEILDGGSLWTLRRLADVLSRKGRHQRALTYYERLEELAPDDPNLAYRHAVALAASDKPVEAEAAFHKAQYLMPDSVRPLRGLAWVQLLNGKAAQAAETLEKVFAIDPIPEDYLNAGHAARALGNIKAALNFYVLYMGEKNDENLLKLEKAINADSEKLQNAGINPSLNKLIIEFLKL